MRSHEPNDTGGNPAAVNSPEGQAGEALTEEERTEALAAADDDRPLFGEPELAEMLGEEWDGKLDAVDASPDVVAVAPPPPLPPPPPPQKRPPGPLTAVLAAQAREPGPAPIPMGALAPAPAPAKAESWLSRNIGVTNVATATIVAVAFTVAFMVSGERTPRSSATTAARPIAAAVNPTLATTATPAINNPPPAIDVNPLGQGGLRVVADTITLHGESFKLPPLNKVLRREFRQEILNQSNDPTTLTTALQRGLNKVILGGIREDGQFGRETGLTVWSFQRKAGGLALAEEGDVGRATWAALQRAVDRVERGLAPFPKKTAPAPGQPTPKPRPLPPPPPAKEVAADPAPLPPPPAVVNHDVPFGPPEEAPAVATPAPAPAPTAPSVVSEQIAEPAPGNRREASPVGSADWMMTSPAAPPDLQLSLANVRTLRKEQVEAADEVVANMRAHAARIVAFNKATSAGWGYHLDCGQFKAAVEEYGAELAEELDVVNKARRAMKAEKAYRALCADTLGVADCGYAGEKMSIIFSFNPNNCASDTTPLGGNKK